MRNTLLMSPACVHSGKQTLRPCNPAYRAYAKIGLNIPLNISTWIGIATTAVSFALFLPKRKAFEASPA
ncbi:hypothetical protein [Nitratidesulfovibrio liaohensis]|uniref:hypothetical protein n=1 Tax=Nitratidesulfovibrio liaohensis TaxID=2604158 RepID=UPI00141FD9AF|nr:hypothetical protein [Nitratidesulfovibrio liaohensis]NHZ46893.1 hypothetical protein [Nitratidesulfovibrio liaohensis]